MTTIEIVGSPLYQWEVGRQIQVTPSLGTRITAIQFASLGDEEALSVVPSKESGVIIADIPNILLQNNRSLVVYVTDVSDDCVETFTDRVFTIIGMAKPSDYVYSETEVLNYSTLDARLRRVEAGGGSVNALPPGGKAGQFLRKRSDADHDVEWSDFVIPEQYGLVSYDQDKTITIT